MNIDELSQTLSTMDPTELALGVGFVGILMILMLVGGIVWYFLSALGYFKMYKKAGEAGWKAFIPLLTDYVKFKIAWTKKFFWIYLVCLLVFYCLNTSETLLVLLLSLACGITCIVFGFKNDIRMAKSFGKSTGWGVALFFFPFIVSLILGFGKATYIGNTTVAAANAVIAAEE